MNYTGRFDATFDHEGAATHSHAYLHVDSSQVHAPADAIIIPDAQLLFRADYKKSGADLILSGDHHEFVVHDYFRGAHRSALASPDGAHLTAEIVRALVGEVDVAQAAGNPAAGQVIGHVTKLQGSATVIRNGVSVILNMGDNVEKGDVVQTGSSSTCGITFIDGTVFGLSSNARMVLNEMVYDPNGSSNSSLLSLVAGTITFVAGETAKHGDMKIDTPVATMGIRGTAVLVEIDFSVPGSNQSPGQQSQPAPSASFQVLVEPDGTTGSYILFDKTTLQPIAIVNQAGQQININNGVISQTTTPLSPDVQKLITDVFQQKFTDNSNTKTTAPFNDSITPTSGPVIVKTADNSHVTATTVTANLGGSITPQTQSAPTLGVQHVAGAPTVTIGDLFNHLTTSFTTAELGAHTGSTLPDGAAGNIAFHDINAGDLPTVRSDFFSVTYTNAIGSYTLANGQASPPPGLSNLQMHDILATEVDLSLVPAGNNANDGSALFFYSIADKAFDFLAKGEKLTLTYDITVNNNYAQFPEKTIVPITITITGANDAPVISTPAQTIAISAGTGTEGGPLKSDNPTSGTFAFADVDLTDTHKVSVELTDQVMSNKGSIPQLPEQFFKNALVASIQTDSTGTGNGVVHWQFGGDPSDLNDPANLPVYLADFIPVGQTLTLTYTITLTDSSGDLTTDSTTETVTVTITGTAPAAEVWIHTTDDGHDNLWTDGLNWETGNAPASTDDVIIITDQLHPHTPAYPATIADGDTAQANSVTMNDFSDPGDSAHESPELDVQSGGSLSILAAASNPNASGALSLSADSILNNAGTVTVDGDVAMLRTLDPHGNPVVNKAKIENSGTFTIDGGVTLQDYAHLSNSGTMTIAGSLGLLNLFDQDGGLVSLNGSVIDNSDTLNLDSGGTFQGHARFANDGTVTAEGAMNWLDLLDADGNLVSLNQGVICNSGTLTLGQGGQLQGLVSVTNTGTIDVTGGTLGVLVDVANTHGEIDGQITVEKGATLALGSDTHNTSVHGGITGGTVTIKGVLDLQGSNFLSDGTLVNTGNIDVVSTGNSLDGETVNNLDGTITVTGTLLLDDRTTISGGDLTNSGTLQIESASGASLDHVNVDNSGGTITVDGDSSPVTVTLTLDDGTTITNGQLNIGSAGVLEISPETGATLDDVSVSNSGNIQIDEGATLLLDDGTVISGGSLSNSGTLQIESRAGATLDGVNVDNSEGTIAVDCDSSPDTVTLTLSDGTTVTGGDLSVGEVGILEVTGDTGATLDGVSVSNSCLVEIGDGSTLLLNDGASISGGSLGNGSTLQVDGATFDNVSVENADGTIEIEDGSTLLLEDGTTIADGDLTNSGTLQIESLAGATLDNVNVDNSDGTIAVDCDSSPDSVTLTLSDGTTISGGDLTIGAVGILDVSGDDEATLDGVTVNNSGQIEIDSSSTLLLNDGASVTGGNLGNGGTLLVDSPIGATLGNVSVENAGGTIEVDGGSTLVLENGTTIFGGDLTNSGTLQIETASGASLDHVNVDNSGGTIAVDCDSSPVTVTLTLDDGTTIANGQLNIGSAGILEISPETGATLDDVSVSNSGNIQIDEGATLLLDDGTVISGGDISNSGALQIESADGATLDNVSVDNSGGIIAVDCDSSPGTVTLTLSDGTTVTGGDLSVGEVGILEVTGDTGATLDGVSVSNSGLVEIGDGSTLLLNDGASISGGSLGNGGTLQVDGATFDNVSVENADGTIEIEDGSTLLLEDGTTIADGDLSNSGTLQIESLAGATLDNVNVDNSDGTIAVDRDSSPDTVTLTLSDGAVVTGGSLSIGSVGILEVSGDDGATLDGVTVNNSGNIQIDGGSTLLLDDGTTIFSGDLANAGTLDIETSGGATLDGVNVDNSGGNVEVDDPASPAIVTLTLDGGTAISNGTITVGDVGVVEVSGDTAVAINNAIINSTGVIQVDDGATLNLDGSTVNGGTITDDGTVVVDKNNTLKLNGAALSGGRIDNAGTVEIIGSGSIENDILANAAAVLLIDANQTLTLDGTTITGGAVTNNGTVNVDADTTLTLNTVTITGGSVTNAGTIASTGGGAIDNADISNTGTIESTVGVMTIDPAGPPSFTLTNSGFVQANGGELDIAGEAISNSGTVQAVGDSLLSLSSLTVTNSGNGHVSVEKGSTLDLSDSGISGGRVTISGTLESHGTSFVDAAITNNGGIEVMSGLLTLSGSINGTGSATIDANATLELNLDDTQSVVFNGAGAELKLDGLHLTGAIAGFAATDRIDLGGIAYGAATTATYNPTTGVLSVSDGNGGHIDLDIGAGYSGAHFAGGSDNDGGALITLNAGDGAPAFTQGAQTASFHEQPNVTGSSSLDPASPDAPASGTLTFTDIDLTDRPTVSIGTQTVVWTAADGHTDLSASLTSDQISALEQALTLTPAAGNANNGSVGWNYSIADSALDFLGAGQTLTVTSNATVDDHQGGTASAPITITISGADDGPTIAYGGTSPVSTGEGAPATINGLGVADVDGGNSIEQLTLSVAHGTITFDGQTGSSLTISGTIANLDAALANGVTYTAADGYSGSDALQVAINDQAPNGAALSASTSVAISVVPDVLTANDDAIANAATPSGSGWVLDTENGHYYRLVTTTLSWSDANAQAQADGTYLATITSADEQAFVAPLAAGDRAWLGGGATDDATGTGHFVWLTGPEAGTPFDYTHWRAGEPNGGFGSTEYVHIEGVDDAANGGWNDAPDAAGGRDFIEEWGGLSGQIVFNENTGTTIAESVLLANDTDSLGRTFSITGVSAASAHGGTITLDGHSIDYTPAANFSGADSFTYTISDGVTTSTGTVSFNVAASEQGPSDNAPSITSGPQTANVADGGVFSASGQLTAADPDFGDTLSWSIDGGSSVVSQDFDYGLHELKVVKNSTLIFDDTYNGTAPPNGPNFLVGNTNPSVYALSGGSIAPGGPGSPALLEGATAAPVGLSLNPASYDQIVYGPFATLLTNNTPGLTNGLRSNQNFSASATFDLDDPSSTSTRYGIRFSDRQSTPGANGTPAQPGTETVDLTVEHNAGGSMSVMLDEINFETGVATALQTIPIVTGHNDNEIVLKLSNAASSNGNVVASYQLMYQNADGREVADGGPVVFSQTGRIFDNENWTHVQVYGQSLAVPETTSTPSDVAANAVSYLQGTYGTLAVNESNGTWQYYLNPGLASVKALAQGQTAHDIFSVIVTDASGQHGSAPVDITVTGINDAPTASFDGSNPVSADQGTPVVINGLSVADVDGGSSLEQLTLSVAHGTITFDGQTGASITISDTLADLNAALAHGVSYSSAAGYSGSDALQVTINDEAANGHALSASSNVAISVTSSGPPLVTITVDTPDGMNFQDNHGPLTEMGKAALQEGATATTFTLVDTADNVSFVVDGSGFTFDGHTVTGGTLTSFHEFSADGSTALADFTGFSVDAATWMADVQQAAGGDSSAIDALTSTFAYDFIGGAGPDTFGIGAPAGSHSTLTGGGGADTFEYDAGFGAVTITDFDQGNSGSFDHTKGDKIDLFGFSGKPTISYVNGNTVADFGNGDVLTLLNVNPDDLNNSDFNSNGGNNGGGNNHGPVVNNAGNNVTYNGSPVMIDPAVSVTDSSSSIESVNVWISSGYRSGDALTIGGNADGNLNEADGTTIHYHFDPVAGGIFLQATGGSPSFADFNAALEQIQFSTTSNDPTAGGTDSSRDISWAAHDNADQFSQTPTTTVNIDIIPVVHWINPNGGDFHTASNWDVNQVPGANADVVIDATPNFPAIPSYGVSLTSDATIHSLDVAPFAVLGMGGVALNAAGSIDVAGALFGTGLITADSLTVQTTDNVSEGTLPPTTFAGAVGASGGVLIIDTGAFSNQGGVMASEGTLQIGNIDGSTDITNLQADADHAGGVVLAGGAYMASDFTGNTPTSIVFESSSPITTLDAWVTLFGASTIISDDAVLQDSLQKIGEGGSLSLGDTLNSVASFADSNAVDVSGAIHLQGGSFSAASLTIETGGVVDGYGQLQAEHNGSFGELTNNGTMFASGGAVNPGDSAVLEIAGHIDGTGMLEIGGAYQDGILQIDPVETALVNGISQSVVSVSGQTVQFDSFHGQASTEQLIVGGAEVDSNTFNASINGFAAGDTIDLTGVGVADHWSFDGATLTITSDGSTLATLNFTGLSDSTVFSVNADHGGAGTTIGIVPPPHPAPTIDTSDFTLSNDGDITAIQGLQVEDNDSSVSSFTLTTSTGDAPESSVMPSSASGDLAIINDAVSSVVYNPGANPPQADQVNLTVSDNFGDSSTVHFVFNEAGTGPNITLTGTPGNDVIFATGQPDTLTGNGGQDQFVFKPSSPTDTVTVEHTIADFNVNLDTIDLRQLSNIGSAGDVLTTAIQHGGDTLLTLDDHQTLLLKNVIPTQLHTNDFIIAPH